MFESIGQFFSQLYESALQYFVTLKPIDYYTMSFVVGSAALLVLLERFFPYKKSQKFLHEGFLNDFFLYTFAQSYVLGFVFSKFVNFLDAQTGIRSHQILTDTPVWLIVICSLLFHDLYIFWFHRWMHNNKYLWRLHEAHHSTKEMDWLSGSRSHAFEILINQTIEFGILILLGAPSEAIVIKGAISAVWGMWIHANINVNTGSLQYVINGPEMHRWHHADKDEEAYNRNFATKFAFWDWLFGTAYLPRHKQVQFYGISNYFPANFIKQFFFAFRKFEK